MLSQNKEYRPRSFVHRNSRQSEAQKKALRDLWPRHGIDFHKDKVQVPAFVMPDLPLHIDIGFGSGQALLACAAKFPNYNFLGIEVYRPGLASVLLGIENLQLTNVRLVYGDAFEFVRLNVEDESLASLSLFFPDPWPKRRHHPRRLVQSDFIALVLKKLKTQGGLHIATDWEDYACQMLNSLQATTGLRNLHADFAPRSPFRPIVTKFEQRAMREGRNIRDLQFIKAD